MKKKIKYSPDAAEKLKDIKASVTDKYGKDVAKKVVTMIFKSINGLVKNEEKGPSVEVMFDIPSDYRYLCVSQNYVFYRIEEKYIYIVNIYNEKEDSMWHMFGIDTTPQETIDYWGE